MSFAAALSRGVRLARFLSRRTFFVFLLVLFLWPFPAANPVSAAEPVSIGTKNEFIHFREQVNKGEDAGGSYRLTADIDLEGETWIPIGVTFKDGRYFTGEFDGGGHTVRNFIIRNPNYSSEFAGLFGIVSGDAKISNLKVTSFDIEVGRSNYSGGELAVDFIDANATLSSGKKASTYLKSFIRDLFAGGLVGVLGGKSVVANCEVSGDVSVTAFPSPTVFGISGASFALAGGLAGVQLGGSVTGASAAGSVSASTSGNVALTIALAGGMIGGQVDGSITGSYATNTVSVSNGADNPLAVAGGFAGIQAGGRIETAFAAGAVSGKGPKGVITGGFIGTTSASIAYELDMPVSMPLIGNFDIHIDALLGGASAIKNSYAAASVSVPETGDLVLAGGFVGYRLYSETADSAGQIRSCYAAGRVSGPKTGSVAQTSGAGGFIGYNTSRNPEVSECVFDKQSTGKASPNGEGWELSGAILALSNAEMTGGTVSSVLKAVSPSSGAASLPSALGTGWLFTPGYYPELQAMRAAFPAASALSAVPELFAGGAETNENAANAFKIPKFTPLKDPITLEWTPLEALKKTSDETHWFLIPAATGQVTLKLSAKGMTKSFSLDTVASPTFNIELSAAKPNTLPHTFPSVGADYSEEELTPLGVTVINIGNQATGELTAALSGAGADAFSISGNTVNSIAVESSASFSVAPKGGLPAGDYAATVTVSGGNGIGKSFGVNFTVNPLQPEYGIALSDAGGRPVTAHTFPSRTEGGKEPAPFGVTVTNTGDAPTGNLTVALSGTGADDFSISRKTVDSLSVGDGADFTVAPKAGLPAGDYAAAVTVSGGNGIEAGFNVSFKVELLEEYGIELLDDSLAPIGSPRSLRAIAGYDGAEVSLAVSVRNTGASPTGPLTAALLKKDAGVFECLPDRLGSIAPGETAAFTVVPRSGLESGTYSDIVEVSGGNGISESFDLSFTVVSEPPSYGGGGGGCAAAPGWSALAALVPLVFMKKKP
jgi:hypothetical protein